MEVSLDREHPPAVRGYYSSSLPLKPPPDSRGSGWGELDIPLVQKVWWIHGFENLWRLFCNSKRFVLQNVHIKIRIFDVNLLVSIGVVEQGWDFEKDVLRVVEWSGQRHGTSDCNV